MRFLKKLFSSGSARGQNPSMNFYIRPKRCQEIVEVRVDLYNDLSQSDPGQKGAYFTRKIARGARCPFPSELTLYFDNNRRLIEAEVIDGEQVSAEDYDAFMAAKAARAN